jgi:16S rRNA (guanine527-N7)-methyltransferase
MEPRVPAPILPAVAAYLEILDHWNARHALTALPRASRFEELIQDAAALLPHLEGLAPGGLVADFGSGMGIPSVVLALARPDLRVVALDKSAKKGAFMRQVALELALANLEVRVGRAEALEPLRAHAGVAKAVGTLGLLAGWWGRHGRPGAPFLALKGPEEALEGLEGARVAVSPYELPTRGRRAVVAFVLDGPHRG